MALEITKVLYDVSQAIKELTKLDKKVDKSGKKTKQTFTLAGGGIEKLGGAVGKINPKLGNMVTKFGGLAVKAGPAAVAISAIGAAVAVTAANLFDLAGALRDADATLGSFLVDAKKAQEFAEILSTSGDVKQQESFLRTKDLLSRKRVQLTQAQIQIDAARETAAKIVGIEQGKLREIAALQKKAVDKTKSLEDRLAARQQKSLVGGVGAGKPTGSAIIDLTSRAKSEAEKGNIDTAEALLDKAEQLSAELGNHAFFTNKIESANNAIDQSLKDQIKDSKSEESNLSSVVGLQQQQVDLAKEHLAEEVKISKEIANRLKLIGASGGAIRRGGIAEKRVELVDAGLRDLQTGQKGAREGIQSIATEGSLNQLFQNISDGFKALKSFSTINTIGGAKAIGTAIDNKILDAILLLSKPGVTTRDLDVATKMAEQIQEAISKTQRGIDQGVISPVIERQLQLQKELLLDIKQATASTGKFGPLLVDQDILAGSTQLQTISDAFQQQARDFGAQITVNAVLQGGVFDENAIKDFVSVLRREIRKEVARQGE